MPSLDTINDPVPDQAPEFGVLRHNAEWAGTFGTNSDPRAPVNLATRARYRADRDAYATALVDEHARQTQQAIQTDKTRQALFFKTQQLKAQQDAAQFRMGISQEKHDAEMGLVPLKKEALRAQTAATLAREEAVVKQTARTAAMEAHKDQYLAKLAEMPFDLTPEQEDEWRDAAARQFPGAAKHEMTAADVASSRKNLAARRTEQARIEAATVADARKVAAVAAKPEPSTQRGGKTSPDPGIAALKTALAKAVVAQTTSDDKTTTEDGNTKAAQFQPGIDKLKAAIAEKEKASQAPATAAPIRMRLVDGKLVPVQ
jgi:hypothetical protein